MPLLKLTNRSVDGLMPAEKSYVAFDPDLQGFGVRGMPGGSKSWVAEYRSHGGGRGVAKKRVTFGKSGSLTADQERQAAVDFLVKVRLGSDPATGKKELRAAFTVVDMVDAFKTDHVQGKLEEKSGKVLRGRVDATPLGAWLAKGGLHIPRSTRCSPHQGRQNADRRQSRVGDMV